LRRERCRPRGLVPARSARSPQWQFSLQKAGEGLTGERGRRCRSCFGGSSLVQLFRGCGLCNSNFWLECPAAILPLGTLEEFAVTSWWSYRPGILRPYAHAGQSTPNRDSTEHLGLGGESRWKWKACATGHWNWHWHWHQRGGPQRYGIRLKLLLLGRRRESCSGGLQMEQLQPNRIARQRGPSHWHARGPS